MKVLIDQSEVDPVTVGPPALNYGQHWRWEGLPRRRYEYILSPDEFLALAEGWWGEACSQLRADLPFSTRGEDPALDRLEELDYPRLEIMLRDFAGVLGEVLQWDELGLLQLVGRRRAEGSRLYVVNSLEDISISREAIRFAGVAYEVPNR